MKLKSYFFYVILHTAVLHKVLFVTFIVCVFFRVIVMSKLKTHSGASKRFRFTSSGKIRSTQMGKQHNMRKRSKRSLRNQGGTVILGEHGSKIVRYYLRGLKRRFS